MSKHQRTEFDIARDELMSHIHRCGVLKATPEQQDEWLADTMQYMGERYTTLTEEQVSELRVIGRRFCQPVISNSRADEESSADASDDSDGADSEAAGSEQGELAGAA